MQRLVGEMLPQICVGQFDVQLRFYGDMRVDIWNRIRTGGSSDSWVEPFTLEGLHLLLPLLNRQLTAVAVSNDGNLELVFDETRLICKSDEDYESWTFAEPTGDMVVCTAGGELAWVVSYVSQGEPMRPTLANRVSNIVNRRHDPMRRESARSQDPGH
jgi:hypothetical protein